MLGIETRQFSLQLVAIPTELSRLLIMKYRFINISSLFRSSSYRFLCEEPGIILSCSSRNAREHILEIICFNINSLNYIFGVAAILMELISVEFQITDNFKLLSFSKYLISGILYSALGLFTLLIFCFYKLPKISFQLR